MSCRYSLIPFRWEYIEAPIRSDMEIRHTECGWDVDDLAGDFLIWRFCPYCGQLIEKEAHDDPTVLLH